MLAGFPTRFYAAILVGTTIIWYADPLQGTEIQSGLAKIKIDTFCCFFRRSATLLRQVFLRVNAVSAA